MKLYFKTICSTVIPFIVAMFGSYLVGSFINAAFAPIEWTIESRQFMSIVGILFGIALYGRLKVEGLA